MYTVGGIFPCNITVLLRGNFSLIAAAHICYSTSQLSSSGMSDNMNKGRRLRTKCSKEERRSVLTNLDVDYDEKKSGIVQNNDNPQMTYDTCAPGHSTPIRRKECTYDMEDSMELDYRCSPIMISCTQEGGNEVAWDWQGSVTKSCDEIPKNGPSHADTPKRSRLLQKKRNSNSPLLQKPLKRKLVKLESMQNIGKFNAELQALTEKMRTITPRQRDQKDNADDRLSIELESDGNDDIILEVTNDEAILDTEKNNASTVNRDSSSYEDFFDDSIDDSMIRCSQEIEERFNLDADRDSVEVKKGAVSTSWEASHRRKVSSDSIKDSKNLNRSDHSPTIRTIKISKALSRNSSSSISSVSNSKELNANKSHLNNNFVTVKHENSNESLWDTNSSEFEIPDDSFDDCLATCMDEKLLTKSSEYDDIFSDVDRNISNLGRMQKQCNDSAVKNKQNSSAFVQKIPAFAYERYNKCKEQDITGTKATNGCTNKASNHTDITRLKAKEKREMSSTLEMENRKFFKTKSLSDQYFGQVKNVYSNNKSNVTATASHAAKSSINSVVPLKSQVRSTVNNYSSSVSTNIPVNNDRNISPSDGVGNMRMSDVDRYSGKEGRTGIIKYKSTGNLIKDSEKVAKDSQPIRCTPEEIEKKRIEAKMRLEAKRKLQLSVKADNTSKVIPVKRPIKR
ncbi:hypothetical protein KM043_000638 [Ampulex compressa]|nr:hypothetical protein KM043_000638 [Ampulex compressa]